MITCEAFVAWRLERTDLCNLFARGVDVGWEARPGGGVVVVRNLVGGERLTYRTLEEAGGFVDGFHWGGVSRVAVPPPPRPTIGDAVSAAFYGPIREIAVRQGHARTCGIITGEDCDCGHVVG